MSRPSTIVISDWLANCRAGQWTPFEAATALKQALEKDGYIIVANEPPASFRCIYDKMQRGKTRVTAYERRCQKCGCATKGEEAWVDGEIWCHPCADNPPVTPPHSTKGT